MSVFSIDPTKSIHENYNAACIRFRELDKTKKALSWLCVHCERPESEHYEGQCASFVTSRKFSCIEERELDRVLRSLALLDSLLDIVKET